MANCQNGVLGWLWSLIGSATPAYSGTGQPVPGRGWCGWFSTTPTYQVALPVPPTTSNDADLTDPSAGNGASGNGMVSIVIRRE